MVEEVGHGGIADDVSAAPISILIQTCISWIDHQARAGGTMRHQSNRQH